MLKSAVNVRTTTLIPAIAAATVLGGLVAYFAVSTNDRTDWGIRLPFSGSNGKGTTALATEAWPICTTMASVAADAEWVELDPDFKAGKRALAASNWNGAIVSFTRAALRDPLNADIQNYVGYSYRRLRQLGPAIGHYQQALMLNPRHRSAHEHLGEAYLVLGEPTKAEQHLATLENLCLLLPCQEYDDLKRAIAAYRNSAPH
ncbi:tetratricopeptide repeat protein [Bradyrhizobium sp. CCGB20]|uniref:tetratricopeptide repeat protein n=1 Tax=Bradyrhizobium sp. CCGB20 TaxID=2949633 RepID=UPI0020B3CA74|nr:tetratricopeptide repeat protein [Bradyrhizobium sp. CCGB20]MCP3399492.1 tetratricopeptide repeat protein [Bradyrhizobium sp. CCGB20]